MHPTYSSTAPAFPRVQLPGTADDRAPFDELAAKLHHAKKMRMGFILFFLKTGRQPFQGISGNERKARRATGKRQRAARKAAR